MHIVVAVIGVTVAGLLGSYWFGRDSVYWRDSHEAKRRERKKGKRRASR